MILEECAGFVRLPTLDGRPLVTIVTTAFGATWPFATGLAKVGNPHPMQSFTW
jgi:hypothetical protein